MHCNHSPVCERALATSHFKGQGIFKWKSWGTSLETLVTDYPRNALLFFGGVGRDDKTLLLKHSGAPFQTSMSFWKEARFFTGSFRLQSLMRQFPCSQLWGRKGGDTWNVRLENLEPTLFLNSLIYDHLHCYYTNFWWSVWCFTECMMRLKSSR